MDNITHTLVGVTLGHALSKPQVETREKKALIWASMIASNLPDADFIIDHFAAPNLGGNLGYLLHHRGFTHTLAFSPASSALSLFLGCVIARYKGKWTARLFLVSLLATWLHVAADACNEYGVHPFWPISNRWFYGDFIFVAEPLFWYALIPFAIFHAGSLRAQRFWAGLALILMILPWVVRTPSFWVVGALMLWAGLWFWANRKWKSWTTPALGVAVAFCAFVLGAHTARGRAWQEFQGAHPDQAMIQFGSSPAPGNPFCWRMVQASRDSQDRYFARGGELSLAPGIFKPGTCFPVPQTEPNPPLYPARSSTYPEIVWKTEFQGDFQELKSLAMQSCQFLALMKFARVPYWKKTGDQWIAGDLRYHFANAQSRGDELCVDPLPPWEIPVFK